MLPDAPKIIGQIVGKRCVVLGAGGFIGTNLCAALAAAGASVVGFGRRGRVSGGATADEWITGEFDDKAALARAVAGADLVFHLLGGSNPAASNQDPSGEIRRAVAEHLTLIDTIVTAGVSRLVFVSSGGTVYGPQASTPIVETAVTDPISAYGVAKLTSEKLLRLYGHLLGLDYCILRVANPYGPFQLPNRPQGVISTMIQRALDGAPIEIWGDGSVVRDYLHVDDVCSALLSAATMTSGEKVFNIGSGIGRSLRSLATDIEAVLGRRLEIVHKEARAADIPVNVLDITRAEQLLGWRPQVDWYTGLRTTALWLEATGLAGSHG